MSVTGNLRDFTSKYISLTDSELAYLESFFEIRYFNKKDKLLKEGEVEKYLNFIQSGLARLYFVKDREEIVMQFSVENEIICCYESYLSGKPSGFFSEALEHKVVLSITRSNLDNIYDSNHKYERLGRLFAVQEYLKKAAFEYHRVRVTTQERFLDFVRDNTDLQQRVPQKYLASYLDMKPETFSRMKHFTRGRL